MKKESVSFVLALGIVWLACSVATAQEEAPRPALDQNCVINVLNRTVQVGQGGSWIMPNVPSNMGRIRARATCTQGTHTFSGQTDYFSVVRNGLATAGPMQFDDREPVPVSIAYTESAPIVLGTVGGTHQLGVRATYPDGSAREVTAASEGTNYRSTNPGVASVDADGLVTAHSSGVVLITARKDEVVALKQITVNVAGDRDRDGLPDDFERANGLDPSDPIDAQEDQDGDGLTALQEFQLGTGIRVADSDGDGLNDGEEVAAGADGFLTNPLNADTDGDGLNDGVEVLAGSSPTDPNDRNLAGALDRITVNPPSANLVFNAVSTEVSAQLSVSGVLIDGSTIDLTARSFGTTYTSSDLSIVSFGLTDGEIFGGTSGQASVAVANSGKQFSVAVTVERFQPAALSSLTIPGYANNVDVDGPYAYVAAGNAGLQIVDVSDRSHPAIVASVDTDGVAIDVRVFGSFAFIADGPGGLKVIDISNPLAPQLVASADTAGVAQDLKVDNQFAYVADGNAGVEIFDVRDPTHPFSRSHIGGLDDVKGIDAEGTRAVVVAGSSLYVLDVTDRSAPLVVGTVGIGSVKDVVLSGNYAYVAAHSSGYRVVRLTDPTTPVIVGGDQELSFVPSDVELSDGLAFFAEQLFPNVIALLNVRNPDQAVFQTTIDLSAFGDYAGTGIALDGSYAYVTEEGGFVRSDFGTIGDTRLFIAQYLLIRDNGGVPPTVVINAPRDADAVVEGTTVTVDVTAADDIGVRDVTIAVDGVVLSSDTARPFQVPVAIPFGRSSSTLTATATDFGGNTASAQISLAVLRDTDHDALADDLESTLYHTDPNDADTDDDRLRDGQEIAIGTNPLAADTDGDGRDDADEIDAGTDPLNPDTTAPTVAAVDPANDALNAPRNGAVTVTFSEPLKANSVGPQTLQLMLAGQPAPGTVRLMPNGADVVFTPSPALNAFTLYDVVVAVVRDRAGNPLTSPFQSRFTTGNIGDSTAPVISSSNPLADAVRVPINAVIAVTMSEAIDPLSVGSSSFFVKQRVGTTLLPDPIPGTVRLADDARTLIFVPNAPLAVQRIHTVTLSDIKDLFGQRGFATLNFTTDFAADATPPQVVATSLADGQGAVPTNAVLSVRINEAINRLVLGGVVLKQGATVLSTQRQVTTDSAGTVIKLIPNVPMVANTTYVFSIGGVEDRSGNVLPTPRVVTFTTGANPDTAPPTLLSHTPPNGASGVPRNPRVELGFSERLNPITVTVNSVNLDALGIFSVPGVASLSPDGTVVRFTPSAPLNASTTYNLDLVTRAAGVEDLAGNRVSAFLQFSTGFNSDSTAPAVQLQSIADAATDVPVNGRFVLRFDTAVSDHCVNQSTVRLTSGGVPVAGTLNLSTDRTTLTFVPQGGALAANTAYVLRLQGVCDLAGNVLPDFTTGFTTSSSSTADTSKPTVSISPPQSALNVPVTTQITFTFSEPVDMTTLPGSLQVSVTGVTGEVAGTLEVNRNVVTFTPRDSLPGNKQINVSVNGTSDLAGNVIVPVNSSFTTGSAGDTTAPHVLSMVPNDGRANVAPGTPVVLTFSESLDPTTVVNRNFMLFANGAVLPPTSIALSTDNRTIVLTAPSPIASVVSVVVTRDVRDLSGNAMVDFVGAFTTANAPSSAVSIIAQFPQTGATAVPPSASIVLYANKPLNAASVQQGLRISQNGVLIAGTITLSDSAEAVTFRPTRPFAPGSVIETFAADTIADLEGNRLGFLRQGSFSVAPDPATTRPTIVAFQPNLAGLRAPVNAVIDVLYNEPLDPTTVNSANVILEPRFPSGPPIPAEVTLTHGGQLIRVRPQSPLAPSHSYAVSIQGITDTTGQPASGVASIQFNTSPIADSDTVAPRVLAFSPPDGWHGVGINAPVRARFDEPINTLTLTPTPEQAFFGSILWENDNRHVRFVRNEPYAANTQITESVATAEDYAGNRVDAPASTTFTTGTGLSIFPSSVSIVEMAPADGAANVPVNAVVRVRFSASVDPLAITLTDVTQTTRPIPVPARIVLEADGLTVMIVPDAAFAPGHTFEVINRGRTFTTAFAADTQPPVVTATSVQNATVVPRNATLQVQFDEPVSTKLAGIVLRQGGQIVPATFVPSGDRRAITLKLVRPLSPDASYVLTVSGVEDLSGNVLAADHTVTFTTTAGPDLVAPTLVSRTPPNTSTGVPRNVQLELQFSEPLSAVAVNSQTVTLQRTAPLQSVAGAVSLSADGTTIRFRPLQPLGSNEPYKLTATTQVTDLAGNPLSAEVSLNFTTGANIDVSAPQVLLQSIADSATGVPVNGRLVLKFDSALVERCVNGETVQLTTNGTSVAGTASLSADHTQLTFIPLAPLAANAAYTLRLQGVCDVAGNLISNFTTGFTTSSSATPDTAPPTVTIVPAASAPNVPVTTDVTLTFNEPVDVTSLAGGMQLTANGVTGEIAANLSISDNVVTLTPLDALPGSRIITVTVNGVRDVAGNSLSNGTSSFTTGAAGDVNAPHVLSVSPGDTAVDVAPGAPIVLTFSESLDASTATTANLGLFVNGALVQPLTVERSLDNRTLILTASVPAASVVSVIATSDVRDLSGNRLADFVSAFTTAVAADTTRPQVVSQFPGSGASGVRRNTNVVLYFSEPLSAETFQQAFHVAQNGVVVSGTASLSGDGLMVSFHPNQLLRNDALVEVFLENTAVDVYGNALLQTYKGSFRTLLDPATAPPALLGLSTTVATFPTGVPINSVIDLLFSEPMDPATVTSANIELSDATTNQVVASSVSLIKGGRVARVQPQSSLLPGRGYNLLTRSPALRDLSGESLPGSVGSSFFRANSVTVPDTDPPHVLRMSPRNDASGVGINAKTHWRFDESINLFSLLTDPGSGISLFWSDLNRDLRILRDDPYPTDAEVTESVADAEDLASHAVVAPFTTTFTTGSTPDTTAPLSLVSSPANNAGNVPVNAVVQALFDEALDPVSVNGSTFLLADRITGIVVAGSVALEADGRTVTLVPTLSLASSRLLDFRISNVRDLAGNLESQNRQFTTGSVSDTQRPSVTTISVQDAQTNVPTNAPLAVTFDEPINLVKLTGVVLRRGGVAVPASFNVSNGITLTFKLVQPLLANTSYELSVSAVEDLSGNVLTQNHTVTFTTGPGADL